MQWQEQGNPGANAKEGEGVNSKRGKRGERQQQQAPETAGAAVSGNNELATKLADAAK